MNDTGSSDDPRLNYTGHTATVVKTEYWDMPGGAQIVLVDQTSGPLMDGVTILDSGGSGKLSFSLEASTPAGAYHLAALDAAGEVIAQTVTFYISG